MIDLLVVKLQMSKIYLVLTLSVYAISVFAVWYYVPYFWLSATINLALLINLYNFLPRFILLNHPQSINQITIDNKTIIIQKNNQSIQRYTQFYPAYQSRFLVIITMEKKHVVVFKDATILPSLSKLNIAIGIDANV